jgi:hypothetical protein
VPTRQEIWLPLAAVVANGLLVGASLDQSIKQLPARRRIGVAAFAAYSQAADLRNGIPWYATLGLGAPALALAAAAVGRRHRPSAQRRALILAAGLSVGHLLVTAVAAPVNFSQRAHTGDPAALAPGVRHLRAADRAPDRPAGRHAGGDGLGAGGRDQPVEPAARAAESSTGACAPDRRADREQCR